MKLPAFERSASRFRGRDVRAGYQRGWGLQFGDLAAQIREDSLYRSALALAEARTIMAEMNRMNIYLILRFGFSELPFGHIVEFGSYRGGSAIFMAAVCRALYPGVQVYAFDTFEGMPETDSTRDAHSAGDFRDAQYEQLQKEIIDKKINNLHLVKGLFEDTAPSVLPKIGAIRMSHIDCDIYSAVKYSYDVSRPYMVAGGYWLFDDALVSSCIGATEAVEEVVVQRDGRFAEQAYPQLVYRNLDPTDAA